MKKSITIKEAEVHNKLLSTVENLVEFTGQPEKLAQYFKALRNNSSCTVVFQKKTDRQVGSVYVLYNIHGKMYYANCGKDTEKAYAIRTYVSRLLHTIEE